MSLHHQTYNHPDVPAAAGCGTKAAARLPQSKFHSNRSKGKTPLLRRQTCRISEYGLAFIFWIALLLPKTPTTHKTVTTSSIIKYWLPVIFWIGLIFFMSTDAGSAEHTSRILEPLLRWLNPQISRAAIEQVHFVVRKCGHLSEYAVLAILCWRALMYYRDGQTHNGALKNAAIAFAVCVVYASSDEFHQSFIPSRGPSIHDVLIDSCGAMIGLSLVLILRGWRIRLARQP